MKIEAPGGDRKDVIFARTAANLSLPLIDVSNPSFAVPDDPESLARQRDAFVEWDRKRHHLPRFVTRLLLRSAAKRSPLVRALFQSQQGYLDSITTYVMKLGEKNLPPGIDGRVDRKIASSPHVVLLRLRMQQIAKLLTGALGGLLEQNNAPLHFINIAGGPAFDSINAAILLRRSHDALLRRPVVIDILDSQTEGPAFGANALAAFREAGGPLHGLDIEMIHHSYDWNDTAPLDELLAGLTARGAIAVASSEGGLFEYGSDEAIKANLRTLSKAGVPFVAGSVTSSSEIRKQMIAETKFRLFPRGIEGFEPLAHEGGYTIARSQPAILSDQVFLQLAPAKQA